MKKEAQILALAGMIVVVLVAVIEFVLIISQTDPSAPTVDITAFAIVVLLYGGVFLFDAAYLEWKQEVNYFITLVLVVIGIVGLSTSLVFHNALAEFFFPRTIVPAVLAFDFFDICHRYTRYGEN
ncbi:MAG: hypothetical protein ACXACG_00690 [Candidatus Thorarchaeota archaeon]|jgi:hypothetical protein